jgi:hypothetical protein
MPALTGYCFLIAAAAVAASTASAEGERRWRIFQQDGGALLAPSHSDEATDDIGPPSFRCQGKSGTMVMTGEANQELRNAVADLLKTNGYPQVELVPPSSSSSALLNVSYSEMNSLWEYSFSLDANEPAFDAFKRTGRLTFKVGKAVIHEEFKAGLEKVATFRSICMRAK